MFSAYTKIPLYKTTCIILIIHFPILYFISIMRIGMQSSPELARELLRALRGCMQWKSDITKTDLHNFWLRMNDDSFNSRMRLFFDMCNRNMDGRITETDIKQTILLTASINKLSVTRDEAEDYAALIMESVDNKNKGYIEISEMETLFKESLLKAYSPMKLQGSTNQDCEEQEQEPMSKVEVLFRTYWRRSWVVVLWLVGCFGLFGWKFDQYSKRSGFEVMGYCLPTAKGAAETLKLNMALILLPVCRNTITWLRNDPRLNYVIPFNDNINFHKLIAGGIVVGVILHGGTHLTCDFPRISDSDKSIFRQTIAAGFGYHQPTYMEILATTEVASGIGMVLIMAIAFSLATKWPRRRSPVLPLSIRRVTGYNTFWYSHHLFVIVYVLLIVHSMFLFLADKWIEKTTWMYIAFPVLLYAGERIFRAIRSGSYEVDVMKASLYPGKVLYLKMQKPDGFKYRSGMYIFIQCPQISPFQWHPFSLTSGPQDEYLSVHIRTLGDWSYQIYALFQEAVLSRLQGCPKLYIDGPYGSASQDHVKYDILVLIGLGIGATPFISILKDVANGVQTSQQSNHSGLRECSSTKGSPSKAYLYWVTREQNSFDWFRDVMKEIANSTKQQSVVEMHNFLTSVYPEGDVRSALLSVIQALHHAKNGTDIVSRTPIHTHFARPNWSNIFSRLARKHVEAKIGVFYCGPSNLATELKNLCTKFSTKTTTRFVFHKENY
ncbi:respiratory burst oxidase homolog protein A isoform X2 [Medicago truncatula]|uniref:respiratory burst oxidase homolog protein A isoform X2 n=1 Tax=Medicago truncatula TaxID=3880 RepID=UPI001967102D|nr:respiratory burst oxidase homolog protein A isoform X2 [Medicago truncatula]